MKTLKFFLLTALMLFVATATFAQDNKKDDYLVGHWMFTVTGTPQGDATMPVVLERDANGKLTGYLSDEDFKTVKVKFTRVEEKGDSFTAYYPAGGYDCYLFAEKIDQDNMEGSVMDMFDSTGVRVKDKAAKDKK